MSNINLGKNMTSLNVGRQLASYTGVIIHAGMSADGTKISYSAGNSSGYVLEIENPLGTQGMADAILEGLKLRNVTYQPFEADQALLDPSAEIGDNVTVNGTASVIANRTTQYTALSNSDISAPFDEEVNSAFKYEPKTVREFKRESAYARSRISQTEDQISLEVVRATNAEGTLSSRITLTADAITAEVARATSTEGTLQTRIDQRLDRITLSASSANGTSTFTIKDGSTTLDTRTLDLTVKAVNINGKLTVGQLADGSVVTSSKSETEYYLSTSSSSATGGSWSTTIPTWTSGTYIWTRTKTTDTRNDNTTSVSYSPQNGAYDKNLTGANTNALSAGKRTSTVYCSVSGGSAPSAPNAWVSDETGGQNVWTTLRPEYSSNYPALYVAQQSETVGGVYSCTTPKIDATTTVIDGAHIITGTIDASKISVNNLQAISATLAGWTLTDSSIRKTISNTSSVQLNAPASPTDNDNAFVVTKYVNNAWQTQIAMKYGGLLYARNAQITGQITATSGTIGGCTITDGVLQIANANIDSINASKITAGTLNVDRIGAASITDSKIAYHTLTGDSVADETVTTRNTVSGINTNLGYGAAYGGAIASSTADGPTYFNAYDIRARHAITQAGYGFSRSTKTVRNSANNGSVTLNYWSWAGD